MIVDVSERKETFDEIILFPIWEASLVSLNVYSHTKRRNKSLASQLRVIS